MKLREDPEPLRVVPQAQRDVWEKKSEHRCQFEDGRGRCTSYDTKAYRITYQDRFTIEYYCEKHALGGE